MSSYKNLSQEPSDHAIGRSRGGLSTKIHHLVDGRGLPLVVLVGAGQAGDAPMFLILMDHLRVARRGPGRPRTRPDRVRGDKAYSSRAIRQHLRWRGIVAVIPEPSDQQGHHKRRGSRGGRPVGYDVEDDKGRNVVERGFNEDKQWRGLATRYDKLALTYRGGAVLTAARETRWLGQGDADQQTILRDPDPYQRPRLGHLRPRRTPRPIHHPRTRRSDHPRRSLGQPTGRRIQHLIEGPRVLRIEESRPLGRLAEAARSTDRSAFSWPEPTGWHLDLQEA